VKTAEDYSEEARLAELEGTVHLAGKIGDDGRFQDLKIVESLGLGLDEQALRVAAQEVYAPDLVGRADRIRVDYHLASKVSRWHLIHAEFQPPEDASRPTFVKAVYPNGAGILSGAAIDEGRLLGAIGRQAFATIAFTIDEHGVPGNFHIENVSETMWGQEAIFLLREWRFKPGTKDGKAIAVPATFEVAWGPLDLSPERVARIREALEPPVARKILAAPKPIEVLNEVDASYTQEALDAKLEGVVVVSFDLVDGAPTNLHVDEGLGKGLDEKALEAVSQFRFKPVLLNGVASPSHSKIRVNFRLDQKAGIVRAK
jgi:TonB family protein